MLLVTYAPEIPVFARRRFAAGQGTFGLNFYTAEEQQRNAVERLRQQSVPVVLGSFDEYEGEFADDYPIVAAYLAEHYREAGTIAVDGEPRFRVLVESKRAAAPRGPDPESAVLPVTTPAATIATRMRHLVPVSLRRAAARVVADRRAADVERRLASLAREQRPIAVGPWLGEVGFELLYWVPFVRWFAERYEVAPDRLIAVTRGGAASWYAPIAGRSFDALAVMARGRVPPAKRRSHRKPRRAEAGADHGARGRSPGHGQASGG